MSKWTCKNEAQKIADRLNFIFSESTLIDEVPLMLISKLLDRIEELEKIVLNRKDK